MTKIADDGFVWVKDVDSDIWTLQDSNHIDIAHVYPLNPAFDLQRGPHWQALTADDDGRIIGSYDTIAAAFAAVDTEFRLDYGSHPVNQVLLLRWLGALSNIDAAALVLAVLLASALITMALLATGHVATAFLLLALTTIALVALTIRMIKG